MEIFIVVIFAVGYLAIAFEHQIRINKTASALLTGVLCWTLFAVSSPGEDIIQSEHFQKLAAEAGSSSNSDTHLFGLYIGNELATSLSSIASILFFLIGAMTIVELVDAHEGFRVITDRIKTRDLKKLLWIISWTTFFLSAFLDNLTTAIVMVMVTRKLVRDDHYRLIFAGIIVVAANAGGAWSPIGDVTTTMLWIAGRISTTGIVSALFLPSMICLLIPLVLLTFRLKGPAKQQNEIEPGACSGGGRVMFLAGTCALLFVPLFKTWTHLPPYMGMLLGLGGVWIISELINPNLDEAEKHKYSVTYALSRIDISSVLFFFGILLAVSALESMHLLSNFSDMLFATLKDSRIIISAMGVFSAVLDNVPLVAASIGMFSVHSFPMDHAVWNYLAYCSGTGGSLLIIGSAAGVAVMGMEKITFIWYLKNMALLALAGYAGGAVVFLLLNTFVTN